MIALAILFTVCYAWSPAPEGASPISHYTVHGSWYMPEAPEIVTDEYTTTVDTTTCIDYTLRAIYRVRVRAVDTEGRTGEWSEWSEFFYSMWPPAEATVDSITGEFQVMLQSNMGSPISLSTIVKWSTARSAILEAVKW